MSALRPVLAVLALSGPVAADPPRQAAPPAIADLVRDLGSPRFADRERAHRELWKLGSAAVSAVRAAADSDDPETARRAKDLLDRFDAGIFADTPPAVLARVADFRAGKYAPAVTGLVKLGPPALSALRAQLARGLTAEAAGPVFDHLCWLLRGEVPRLLFDGKADSAEELLALHALGPSTQGLSDYAMLVALRGRTAQVTAHHEAMLKAGGSAQTASERALVFLYRAAGDLKRATALARELEAGPSGRAMLDALLEDGGAWGELADRSARQIGPANSRDGLTLFRLRQAGRDPEADDLADKQVEAEANRAGQDLFRSVDEPTLALLLGGRPLDGIDRLRAKKTSPHLLADVLAARLEFDAALGLVTPAPATRRRADPFDTPELRHLYGTRKGRLLSQLGDRDGATREFNALADQVATSRDEYTLTQLLKSEVRAGRFDLACDHLARGVAATNDDSAGRLEAFEAVFEGDAEAAEYLWRVLRADDKAAAPSDLMRRVRALLTGAVPTADRAKAAAVIAKESHGKVTPRGQARALALAGMYRSAGQSAEAIAALAELADAFAKVDGDMDAQQGRQSGRGSRSWVFGTDERFRPWMELGDLLADAGRWQDAAARYEQGWRRFPDCAVLLYLAGKALKRAGDDAGGDRRIELSHWVGLGNARVRGRFLEELIGRGDPAAVRRERDLIRDAGWLSEMYLGNVWNQVGRAAAGQRDFAAAAAANRRAMHYLLRTPGVAYVEGHAYVSVPQVVRGFEARALLASGKSDAALSLARGCLDVLPGNGELVIGLAPGLDRAGRAADADKLFEAVWGTYGKLIAAHPKSAWARYSAAWLAAGCFRRLDASLAHAKEAVALDPEVRAYQEGLAEVHFRRGERAEAVAVMARLSAADPRHHHFRRQLDRYRTAAFDSPLPESADD